jgi:hypothetical protein
MLNRERTTLGQSYPQGNAVDNAQDILGDIDTELDKAEQKLTVIQTPAKRKVLEARKKILSTMSLDIDRCLVDILIPSGVNLEKLSRIIDEYQHLIDTNLLWVRSDKPVQLADATRLLAVVKQFEPHPAAQVFGLILGEYQGTTVPRNFLPSNSPYRSRYHIDSSSVESQR